jgi:flagella basal body P-ring formation protein FlgA
MSDRIKGFIFGAVLMMLTPAFALQGEPKNALQEASVEKNESLPYFRLTYEDAEEAIGQALAERGAGAKIAAQILNRSGDNIFSFSQPISVEIRGLKYDIANQRFTANLVSVADREVISVKAISGRFQEMVEVPVLKRSVPAGEIISREDIEIRDYSKARARVDTVTDVASLIGKSPVRVISAGRPLRTHELEQAAVVKKNDLVKMIFNQGAMLISTSGQAMDDGGKGAVISVRNLTSKKIVQATVRDESTVIIDGGETRTSGLNARGVYYEN